MKLVSIIIPTYQHACTIGATIQSALDQTYTNIEIIVVDDGSTDETEQIVRTFGKSVRYHQQSNSGSNPARNQGFTHSRGEYIIFLDADVIMEREMIFEMAHALERNPKVSFVYSDFYFGWKFFRGRPFDIDALKKTNYIHTSSLIRREAFPGFDEKVRRFQDWDVWLTIASQGGMGLYLPETLFHVLIEGESRLGSKWLPKFVYRLPWSWLPFKLQRVKTYENAKAIIYEKHGIDV